MVPCPENTPLPNRRLGKDTRAKLLSIYLRPWTLSSKMATTHVPYLLELSQPPSSQTINAAGTAEQEGDATESRHDLPKSPQASHNRFRKPWKQYLRCVLPHAEREVRSFILTSLAEGRIADADDEKDVGKGPAVVCNLSLA